MNIGDYLDEIAYDRNVLIGASMITEEDLRRDIADWNTARETLDRGSLATELKSDRVNCSDVCVCCFNSIVIFFSGRQIHQPKTYYSRSLHTISAI